METNIHTLAGELVNLICDYLEDDEIISLRSSCKRLAKKTLYQFGTRFFTSIRCMLTPLSLEIVEDISQHEDLSQFVRKLCIRTELLNDSSPSILRHRLFGLIELARHQNEMRQDGFDAIVLGKIIAKLEYLETIIITNDIVSANPDFSGGMRNDLSERVIARALGLMPWDDLYDLQILKQDNPARIFDIVEKALIKPVRIDVCCNLTRWPRLSDFFENPAGALPDDLHLLSKITKALVSMPPGEQWLSRNRRILLHPANIQGICISKMDFFEMQNLRAENFKNLRYIKLENCKVTFNRFKYFLAEHSNNLEEMRLDRILLFDMNEKHQMKRVSRTWEGIFLQMSYMANLKTIFFNNLSCFGPRGSSMPPSKPLGRTSPYVFWRNTEEISLGLSIMYHYHDLMRHDTSGELAFPRSLKDWDRCEPVI